MKKILPVAMGVLFVITCTVQAHAESFFIGGVSFDVPAEWLEVPVSSPMRAAQYKIPKFAEDTEDGEMVVFFFGEGQGGDINANILRWQGQFTTPDNNPGVIEKKDIKGIPVTTVYLEGDYNPGNMAGGGAEVKKGYAMQGMIISGPQGNVFVKLLAPKKTVDSANEAFQKMLSTVASTLAQ